MRMNQILPDIERCVATDNTSKMTKYMFCYMSLILRSGLTRREDVWPTRSRFYDRIRKGRSEPLVILEALLLALSLAWQTALRSVAA